MGVRDWAKVNFSLSYTIPISREPSHDLSQYSMFELRYRGLHPTFHGSANDFHLFLSTMDILLHAISQVTNTPQPDVHVTGKKSMYF